MKAISAPAQRRMPGPLASAPARIADTAVNGSGGTGGHGLIGMRERVAAYGGTLDAGSAHGAGFRVHASIPLEDAP